MIFGLAAIFFLRCSAQEPSSVHACGWRQLPWPVVKNRYDRMARGGQRELREVKGSRLAQVGHGFFYRFALGGRPGFRVECDVSALFRRVSTAVSSMTRYHSALIVALTVREV